MPSLTELTKQLQEHPGSVQLDSVPSVRVESNPTQAELDCLRSLTELPLLLINKAKDAVEPIELSSLTLPKSLGKLEIRGNTPVHSLEFLDGVESLQELRIGECHARTFASIVTQRSLKHLSMILKSEVDFSFLCALSSLETLSISSTYPLNIVGIQLLKELKALRVCSETSVSINGLVGLKKLKKLVVIALTPVDLTGLEKLTKLTEIDLFIKGELSIPSLKGMKSLRWLSVGQYSDK
jgi:hypothetical protein